MKITDYLASHAQASVKSDILERWESRVVADGLSMRGRAGAEGYLARYGKGMKAAKAIGFARCAELKGFPDMAARFWEEAFFLEFGVRAAVTGAAATVNHSDLPAHVLKAPFGRSPQLLVFVDRDTAMRYVRDPAYGVQEKKDGERVMSEVNGGQVTAGNKKGLVRPLPLNVADALKALGRDCLPDGELVGTTYWVFELLSVDGRQIGDESYLDRDAALADLIGEGNDSIRKVPLAVTLEGKLALVEKMEREGREGFVMKLLSAPVEAGDGSGTQWKFQFRSTIPVIVGERNGTKDSVEVFVNRADGTLRSLGNVTIPENHRFPQPGEIAEVESLYCHPGKNGKLAQAVWRGVRTDADASDCQESKLRVKAD